MLRRWTIVFALLVVWTRSISLLPITEENGNTSGNDRYTRQLNFGEKCCPCPPSEELNPSGQTGDLVALPDSSRSALSLAEGAARAVDDCPCLPRDSDGAASSLLDVPGKLLAFGTVVKPNEGRKEDPKPLLHPEVGLASSVLQTLREATDEEYQEALARDAAKSVSRSVDDLIFDPIPGASRNIVTIVLNPHPLPDTDDDIITSGTHFHESRCIHPLGTTRSSSMVNTPMDISKSNLLSELLKSPLSDSIGDKQINFLHRDNDFAESNVQKIVVESPKKEVIEMELKSPGMKLFSDDKATNFRNTVKISNPQSSSEETVLEDKTKKISNKSAAITTKIKPDLSASLLALNERINKLNDIINKPLIPRSEEDEQKKEDSIPTQSLRKSDSDADSSLASSNVQVIAARNIDQESKIPDLKLISSEDIVRSLIKPITPTNLFRLRDVELIPRSVIDDILENKGTIISIPNFQLPSLNEIIARAKENAPEPLQIPSLADLFRNVWSSTKNNENIDGMSQNTITPAANPNISNEMNKIKTEILDTVPSPSQNIEILSDTKSVEVPELNSHLSNTKQNSENFEDARPTNFTDENDFQTSNTPQATTAENDSSAVGQQSIEESSQLIDPSANDDINDDGISETSNTNTIPVSMQRDMVELSNRETLSQNLVENTTPISKFDSKEKPNILNNYLKLKKKTTSILDHLKTTPIIKIKTDTDRNTEIIESETNTSKFNCNEIQPFSTTASHLHIDSTETSDEIENKSEVPVQDMQNISNSLLDSSINKESRGTIQDLDSCIVKPDLDVNGLEGDSEQRFTSSDENIDANAKISDDADSQTDTSEDSDSFDKTEACQSGLLDSESTVNNENLVSKSNPDLSGENESNEMVAGASSPIGSTLESKTPQSLLGSQLNDELIVQPSSLIGGGTTNLFNQNSQLPSIEELRERILDLFRGINLGEREPGSKSDFGYDDSESLMLTGASQRRPKIDLPSLQPLKEINLNLFELNPLNLKLDKPVNLQRLGLNMNSLKAKMQVPNVPNLNLKPLKLQSTIGKEDGLLGAALSLGPTSKNNLLATQQKFKESFNLPSLDEMKSVLQSRAEDLIHRAPKLNVDNFRNNKPLKRLDDLRESLHSDAVKHVNAIQKTLSSSFDEAKVRTDSLLGTALNAQPENVFDTLSRARFDVDDRLQELHSTLADHISSVHEMLNEPSFLTVDSPLKARNADISTKIKSLRPLQAASTTSGISRKKVTARKPAKLITSQESTKRSYKPKGKFVTPKSKLANETPALKNSMPRAKSLNDKNKDNKASKMPTSSVLNVQLSQPLLAKTQSANTENDNIRRFAPKAQQYVRTTESLPIRTLSVTPINPAPEVLPRSRLFKRPIKPSPESERYKLALLTTTVSPRMPAPSKFTTANPWLSRPRTYIHGTTPKPVADQRNPQILRSSRDSKNLRDFGSSRLQESLNRFRPNSKLINDPNGSPSEQILTKTFPRFNQLKSGSQLLKKENPEWFSKLKPTYKVSISKMDLPEKTGTFKPIIVSQDKNIEIPDLLKAEKPMTQAEMSSKASILPVEEKSILSKLTESLKNRLSSMDLKLPFEKEKLSSARSESDMMEGTSDILQRVVVSDDLMKEGIPYKCRMVCTRDK